MPLTDIEVRTAKPGPKPYKLSDGGWLFLLVNPTGSKLWRIAYRIDGKEKLLSLGAYPTVSLKEARAKRDEAKALISQGMDPSHQRRIEKLTRAISNATTFKLVADEYVDKQKREGRAVNTLNKIEWLLSLATPKIGDRPISELSPAEVLAVLKAVEARGNYETAKRLRATIGAVCPSLSLRRGLPMIRPPRSRERSSPRR